MKNFITLASIALTCTLFISCGKDEEPAPQPTKTENITESSWKLEDVGFDSEKDGVINVSGMGAVASCQLDNTLSFMTNNTGVTNEGAAKCNMSDPQTSNFNWSFADAEANINVSNSLLAQINGKSKIVTLTSANLTLARDTTITGIGAGWIVVKLKH